MYNIPATAVTEIESVHVIMEGTVNPPDQLGGGSGEAEAPQRYPKF